MSGHIVANTHINSINGRWTNKVFSSQRIPTIAFQKKKIKYHTEVKNCLFEIKKKSFHSLTGLAGCCRACGNVRYIDVSNEECWAPLIHQGWEWAVKSYQASQRPTFSPAQLKWARYCWGTRGAAKPPKANATERRHTCRRSFDAYRGLKGLFDQ